jgi:hypothetical protein
MYESVWIPDPTFFGAEMVLGPVRFLESVEFLGLRRGDAPNTQGGKYQPGSAEIE